MDPMPGHLTAMCNTNEPSPELLAWPWRVEEGGRKCPPGVLPLGLLMKSPPLTKPGVVIHGPIQMKEPPPRCTIVPATPGKSPPPSRNEGQ